jgi:hypothetical protein
MFDLMTRLIPSAAVFTHSDRLLLNPNIRSSMNPKQTATSRPNSSNMDEGVANCDAVLFNTSSNLPATFVKVVLVAFSLFSHLTSIYPVYDRYERPATNTITFVDDVSDNTATNNKGNVQSEINGS